VCVFLWRWHLFWFRGLFNIRAVSRTGFAMPILSFEGMGNNQISLLNKLKRSAV